MSQTVGAIETQPANVYLADLNRLADQLLKGTLNWMDNVTPSIPGNPLWNWVFAQAQSSGADMGQIDVAGALYRPNDDDGSYGNSHAMHALSLRMLRNPSPEVVRALEFTAQYPIQMELASVARYGSTFSGSFSYWAAVAPGTDTDNAGQTYTVEVGQPRRLFSYDQMHLAAGAIYTYFQVASRFPDSLFPSKAALLDLTRRAVVREKTATTGGEAPSGFGTVTSNNIFGNLLWVITNGAEGTRYNNGITTATSNTAVGGTLPTPFLGDEYAPWKVAGNDGRTINSSANSTLDGLYRALVAPDSTVEGVMKFLGGRCHDMLVPDISRQTMTYLSNNVPYGTPGAGYPAGWTVIAGNGAQKARYTAGATPPDRFELGAIGTRDSLIGRAPQRACVLAFMALYDPTLTIRVNEYGGQVNVVTALRDLMRVTGAYLLDHRTGMIRASYPGYLGKSGSYTPQIVEPTFTAYALQACELALLVEERLAGRFDPATIYRWTGKALTLS